MLLIKWNEGRGMLAKNEQEFVEFFKEIDDPRQDEKVLYPLHEILFMVLVGVLGGAESWDSILEFAKFKLHLLKTYFPYKNGLPSISTLIRLIGLIKKSCMESWLSTQAKKIAGALQGELVAFDGKALRGKKKFENGEQNTHLLNVFASELGIALAQKAIPDKSSEISAIHEILEDADLNGVTVSIDAIGCQKEITKEVIERGGDYLLALKANQPSLLSDVESMFEVKKTYFPDIFEMNEKGHGRIERRRGEVLNDIEWLKERHSEWSNLKSVVKITSTRSIKEQETTATRYYISSQAGTAQEYIKRTRLHWAIENNLHWVLDVQFKEDDCQIRKNNAAENMAAVRKMALNIIKNYKMQSGKKRSVSGLRQSFGWGEDTMREVLSSWINKCS